MHERRSSTRLIHTARLKLPLLDPQVARKRLPYSSRLARSAATAAKCRSVGAFAQVTLEPAQCRLLVLRRPAFRVEMDQLEGVFGNRKACGQGEEVLTWRAGGLFYLSIEGYSSSV